MADQAWATPDEVNDLTGTTPSVADVKRAQGAIETIAGVYIEDTAWPNLGAADRRWLRNAVAYQAAFMASTPDYFERMRVASASQDGQSATYGVEALELAPLARKALRKLSWKGSRAVHLAAPPTRDLDARDDLHTWRPIT